ncbi:hypothetical protein [Nocardia crassostreae]|uniref:hypothetical protein n=1 Tax=Nocardia crassostreae TaxID=53428 RepID=UPI000A516DC8|nr:hypothetical protein [Nocardia crassostreae]
MRSQRRYAFSPRHSRRPVLDRCPHCGPPIRVADHDLFWLSIKLGNTVGDRTDLKALLPLLLERLTTSNELDATIVLGKLPRAQWRTWPPAEQRAIEDYLDAVWNSLLAEFPARLGSLADPAEFLAAVVVANIEPGRFLAVWEATENQPADRHLAALVNQSFAAPALPATLIAWLGRDAVRQRLLRAFERDHATPWAESLAQAYDAYGWT